MKEKYHEGKLAQKYGVPVGKIGCPNCGVIVSGAIHTTECQMCGVDMFNFDDTPN